MRRVVGVVAAAVAVVVIVVVAAVAAAAAAAAAELLPLSPRACVQPGSVQSVVQMCALNLMVCAGSCARLGHRVSVRAAGAGQWVQGGLAQPPAGVRGSLGVAQRRAWAVRAQRHLTFAVLSIQPFFAMGVLIISTHGSNFWTGRKVYMMANATTSWLPARSRST